MTMFYKETNFIETPIGKIPKDWEVVKFQKVAEIRPGKSKLNTDIKEVAFIPMELIPEEGIYANFEMRDLSNVSSYTYCETGDILLAKITPSLENGKQAIMPSEIPNGFALATTEVFPIVCRNIDKMFLFYLLKFQRFRKVLEGSMRATTGRLRVPKEALLNLNIPLPKSFEEQQKIAEILSSVDEAIQKTDEVIAKTERLKKGLMQELLTNGVNLFALEKEKILNSVKRCLESKDHEFGREENLAHHLAGHLRKEFPNHNVDVEVEKTDRLRPDIIIHKRHTNRNLFAIEVKKDWDIGEIEGDIRKLEEIMLSGYNYSEAIFIGFNARDIDSVYKLSNRVNFVLIDPEENANVKIRKREFEDSEIGRIPKIWRVTKLKDVVEIDKESKDPTEEMPNKTFLYIDIDSIEGGAGKIRNPKTILGKKAPSRACMHA